jgi:hypothetical protein
MKTLSEIRQELSSVLFNAEEIRLEKASKYKNGVIFTLSSVLLGISFIVMALMKFNPLLFFVLGIIFLLASIIVYNFTASKAQKEYKNHFKSNILKRIVETMMPDVNYQAEHGVKKTDFNSSQLFSSNHNVYEAEDYFSGKHNGVSFEMSELDVKRRSQSTSFSNGQTKTTTNTTSIFKGIFIIINSNKSTYGETYILPDSAEKMFGNFGKFLQKSLGSLAHKGSLIYLEQYPDFEKHFVVYCTEEIESQKLLSQNLIQSILDIYARWKVLPSFAFIQNKIYVAVPYRKDLLKVSLHKSLIDNQEEILQKFIDETALCMSIIDELSEEIN